MRKWLNSKKKRYRKMYIEQMDGWMDGLVNDHAGKERERKGVK